MKFNVHAGHNPDGKIACGACGFIKESTEARYIKDEVIKGLKAQGHTVYDCTVNDGTSQQDILRKIVAKCNAHKVDYDISIHFNAGANDSKGNGITTGVEVHTYDKSGAVVDKATKICELISKIGFKNRWVKVNKGLYVLNNTKAPAMLIEVCFVDDKDDADLYNKNKAKVANAIVEGLTGKAVTAATTAKTTTTTAKKTTTAPKVSYYKKYTGKSASIVDALKAIGVDSSFSNRRSIAKANGISLYVGTAKQNTQLLNLLKQGKLVK